MRTPWRALPLAALIAVAVTPALPAPAVAAPADAASVQDVIDAALARAPGGVQTGPNTVEWEDGAIELTVADPAAVTVLAVGSCATGAYCAYDGTSLTGSKLTFWTCDTVVSTSVLSSVGSIANARATGVVQARNSSGIPMATVSAGGQLASAPAGVTSLRCVS